MIGMGPGANQHHYLPAPVAQPFVSSPRPMGNERLASAVKIPGMRRGSLAGSDQKDMAARDYSQIGGPTPGAGPRRGFGRDTIPAKLAKGEFVVNAPATQRHRAELEKINEEGRHAAQGGEMYAKGGKVETIGPTEEHPKALHFKKGALHRQLGVPEGEKIPAAKMAEARSGKLGAKAEKRANFAKNVLHR